MTHKNETVTVMVAQVGVPDKNGIIFTETALAAVAECLAHRPNVFGVIRDEFSKPWTFGSVGLIDPDQVSHKVENLRMDGDKFMADITPLKNSQGAILNMLMGLPSYREGDYRFALRGHGRLNAETKTVTSVIPATIDFFATQS